MSFFVSRKAKKKAQEKKNKYHQMIYELVRLRRDEDIRVKDEEKRAKLALASTAEKQDDLIWSAKVGEVRNRLTDKKRAATERWNRFAGTEGGGGRGL